MSYCTLENLKDQLSEQVLIGLTDDDNQTINQTVIDGAIQAAESEIDGYAQKLYDVPFNPVPEVIKKLCIDITVYNLFSRRGFDEKRDGNILERYKAAIRFLENLSKGVVTVGRPSPVPQATVNIDSNPRLFSRNSLRGM